MEESHKDLRRAYGESLRHLDDLRRLGGPELAPIAGQIQFHLANMLSAAEKEIPVPAAHPKLYQIAKSSLSELLYNAFPAGEGVRAISQFIHPHASFVILENALSDTAQVVRFARNFKPRQVEFAVTTEGLELSLEIADGLNLAAMRQQAYRLTQEFWRKRALLTYSLSEKNTKAWLSFTLRYASCASKELVYCAGNLQFDAVFSLYESSLADIQALGQHHIVFINENGEASLHNNVPKLKKIDHTFIHLPFLFRPLSLIISGRGKLAEMQARNPQVSLFELFS